MKNRLLKTGRRRLRIGILANGFLGGGQRVAVQAARALAAIGDVELCVAGSVSRRALRAGHGGPLPFRLTVPPLAPSTDDATGWRNPLPWAQGVSDWTAGLDLFVNFERTPGIRPRARRAIFYCHFPRDDRPDLLCIRDYEAVVSNSDFTLSWIRKRWGLHPFARIHPAADLRAVRPHPGRAVLGVGTFGISPFTGLHGKHHDAMIRTWHALCARHPRLVRGWHLVLAGSVSPLRRGVEELRRLSVAGPGRVRIVETPDRRALEELYAGASVFWHPCGMGRRDPVEREHFGIAVAEAMRAGAVPVVADAGGLPEIVEDGVSGFRVRSVAGLASRTALLLEDADLRRRMSAAAREGAERFSVDRFEASFRAVARAVMAGPRARRGPSPVGALLRRIASPPPAWRGPWLDERFHRGRVERLWRGGFSFSVDVSPGEAVRISLDLEGAGRATCVAAGRALGRRAWGPGSRTVSWRVVPGGRRLTGRIRLLSRGPVWTGPLRIRAERPYDARPVALDGERWRGLVFRGAGWRRERGALRPPRDARALLASTAPGPQRLDATFRASGSARVRVFVDSRSRADIRLAKGRPSHLALDVRSPKGGVRVRILGSAGLRVEELRLTLPRAERVLLSALAREEW